MSIREENTKKLICRAKAIKEEALKNGNHGVAADIEKQILWLHENLRKEHQHQRLLESQVPRCIFLSV
jgi:hypothetical protein